MVHQPPTLHSRSFLDPVLESLLQPQAYLSPGVDWRVSRLKQFIDAEHGKLGWSLDSICEQLNLGISGSHGRKLFKKQLGVGIREYTKRKRLVMAAEKLKATTLSVKEIAADLGYKKQTDFRRQFAQLFYLTPSGFRSAQVREAGRNTDIPRVEKAPSRTPRLERRGSR